MSNEEKLPGRQLTATKPLKVRGFKIRHRKEGATQMICMHNPQRPCIRKALPLLSTSIVSLALAVASVGQVSAGDGFASGQSQADPAAHLQLAGVNAPADPHAHHHHMMPHADSTQQEDDPHAHHRHMMDQKGYKRATHDYDVPQLLLLDMDNNKVSLNEALATDEAVMLNFIFTTCTTICPVLSATFTQVQRELGDEAHQVRMISITIDPEYDTPERLREYAVRFNAGPQWQFYTGTSDDIVAVQKAFDAYRGSKANHEPLTFLRVPEDPQWVRVNGLASASDVVKEYRRLLAE
jgi:protein SCO1/2